MASSPKTYVLVEKSKRVHRLGERTPVPIEVDPRAIHLVKEKLKGFPVENICMRMAQSKDGPVITVAGNVLMDVSFTVIGDRLENELSAIPGVIDSGLFIGYSVEILTV